MKILKFLGLGATHFNVTHHDHGELVEEKLVHAVPGDTVQVSDGIGVKLLARGDFEEVKPEPKKEAPKKDDLKPVEKTELPKLTDN